MSTAAAVAELQRRKGLYVDGRANAATLTALRLRCVPGGSAVFDTMNGAGGVPVGRIAAGAQIAVTVAGRSGLPSVTATPKMSSAALRITVSGSSGTGTGWVKVFACDAAAPTAPTITFTRATTLTRSIVSRVDPEGRVCVQASTAVHVKATANGWYNLENYRQINAPAGTVALMSDSLFVFADAVLVPDLHERGYRVVALDMVGGSNMSRTYIAADGAQRVALAPRIRQLVAAMPQNPPDLFFISSGGNDALHVARYGGNATAVFDAGIADVINAVPENSRLLWVNSYIYNDPASTASTVGDETALSAHFNSRLAAAVGARKGRSVHVVAWAAAVSANPTLYLVDLVHPYTAEGQKLLAARSRIAYPAAMHLRAQLLR